MPDPEPVVDDLPEVRNRVIPFATMTAQNCGILAERSATAITALGRGKVGRVLRSRFTTALHRLNQIAARGSYGQSPAELQLDVQAVTVATDFFQIAGVLPTTIPDHIGQDLARALEGKLERNSKSRVEQEF